MCILLLSAAALTAQTIRVNGTVYDTGGETLPGVSVVIKGTTTGVMTDVNGQYTIAVPNSQSVLIYSFIGYTPKEVRVGNNTTINVSFDETSTILDDVVVIGYGSVKKKDLTGAVSAISEKDFQKGGASPDRLIVGKIAGVQVTPNGGAPGSGSRIRIRGGASLTASNDPLIIIDGIPISNSGVAGSPSLLSTINPNDIESMNVLKDASATAIYGSRASNGVIIVTTKQAKFGQKLNINFSTQASISTLAKKLDLLNASQITDIVTNHPKSTDEFRSLVGKANTNWQDEIYQNAFGTDNNLSIAGAVRKVPFRVSIGYLNEDAIMRTGNFERFTGGINLNPRLFNNHLKIDLSLKGSYINNRFAPSEASTLAIGFDPTQPVKAPGFEKYGGYFTWLLPDGNLKTQASTNPVLLLEQYKNESKVKRGIVSAQIDYKMHFLPELRANMNLGYDYGEGEGDVFIPEWIPYGVATKGEKRKYGDNKTNKLFEFYLNYAKDIKPLKSFVDITAGYTYQDWKTHTDNYITYTATGEERVVPDFPFDEPRNTLISVFGRLNYTFLDKYLFTATIRRDGSSRFHPDNRWGTFPSFALAWKLKEESFLKNITSVSDLKLRLGYGVTGQQDIGQNYPYLPRYEMGTNTAQYQFGDQFYYMYRPAAYDQNIKWESTKTYNVALDYGFLDNRINGSVDLYMKKTKDMLNEIDIPAGSNFRNRLITNIGNMENKGIEFTVNVNAIKSKDFNWDFSFNATYNKNKITKLTLVDSDEFQGVPTGWITGSTSGQVQINSVGHNILAFYLYKQIYDENGKPLEGVYADLDNNGVINSNDLYRTKSAEPKMLFGFSTAFNYRNWTLSTVLRGSYGNYMYNNMNSALGTYSNILSPSNSIMNAPVDVLKSNFYLNQPLSDYYLENASFIKMDNISLAYDFGRILNDLMGLRATFSVQNVFTITKYSGIDPEISGGVDRSFYPRPRIFSLGLNVSF